ncbi:MAG: hypothetical protein A3F43_00110 [Gammaproteobacteria bacterium RIFCSPHIGHO2_12_FULL_42_10]|nr:MAG: hypothetical protein A3F43_00110 [Gammaproteobacteria bacterium RIFCSPHIGHO2_12_FULL_42_10]
MNSYTMMLPVLAGFNANTENRLPTTKQVATIKMESALASTVLKTIQPIHATNISLSQAMFTINRALETTKILGTEQTRSAATQLTTQYIEVNDALEKNSAQLGPLVKTYTDNVKARLNTLKTQHQQPINDATSAQLEAQLAKDGSLIQSLAEERKKIERQVHALAIKVEKLTGTPIQTIKPEETPAEHKLHSNR